MPKLRETRREIRDKNTSRAPPGYRNVKYKLESVKETEKRRLVFAIKSTGVVYLGYRYGEKSNFAARVNTKPFYQPNYPPTPLRSHPTAFRSRTLNASSL